MPPSSDPAGHNFTRTLHHAPYPAIDPTLVSLPRPFTVCITGTSRDIGAHIAYAYALAGATSIAICSPTPHEALSSPIGATLLAINPSLNFLNETCDVTSPAALAAFAALVADTFSRLDVLVCNAGFWGQTWEGRVDPSPEEWERAFDVNCMGVWLAARVFCPLLMASEGGARAVVQVCSADMHECWSGGVGGGKSTAYCISKMAGARVVEFLAGRWEGLVAVAVQPGAVRTEMARGLAPREVFECKGLFCLFSFFFVFFPPPSVFSFFPSFLLFSFIDRVID